MAKVGRKGKYDKWLEPDKLAQIIAWRRNGLTIEQVANDKMHIGVSTIFEWIEKFPELAEALKEGKEEADNNVENALYNAAISGNIAAMIFYLKNRRRDSWKDKPEVEQEKISVPVVNLCFEDAKREDLTNGK